ncbi:hypothetical protein K1719_001406 [Acacia pycnantha]|nr:hypothetical protein K1719_001406 [Acacia pycnantha]
MVSPADATYGEADHAMGRRINMSKYMVVELTSAYEEDGPLPKTITDFLPYNGDGFKLNIPSKWNPSKEVEFGVSTWSTFFLLWNCNWDWLMPNQFLAWPLGADLLQILTRFLVLRMPTRRKISI